MFTIKQDKDTATDFMVKLTESIHDNINTMYIGKIVKLNPPTADVQPLEIINGKKANLVSNVHFMTTPFEISYQDNGSNKKTTKMKLNYKVGDNVYVSCLDNDNMYFKNKDKFKVESTTKHSTDYSIIIGKCADKDDFV